MIKIWLQRLNKTLAALAILLIAGTINLAWNRPAQISLPTLTTKITTLPKNSFSLSQSSYDAIAHSTLALKFSPPSMQLPDLRSHLAYYGINGRPDANKDQTMLHFSLANNKCMGSTPPGEKLYLLYDRKQTPARYVFSPDNAETPLWIEVSQEKNEAIVKVSMKNEKGEIVQEPSTYSSFNLTEKEFARFTSGGNWEIGQWRVDGSLLARQRAQWYGEDLFLEKHGGEEFETAIGKQRLDFGEDDKVYSCFVAEGDNLVWDDNRWKEVVPGDDSRGKSLLHVKKVDERLINFELWDPEGKNRIVLNVIKHSETWTPQSILKDFKFIGARTKTQCAFEINQSRMILKPHDWLLLTENGWKKLVSSEEIDDYVNRKVTGSLFVFNGLVKKDDKQMLVGTMYNKARTEMHPVELAVQQSNVTIVPPGIEKLDHQKAEQQAKALLPKYLHPRSEG